MQNFRVNQKVKLKDRVINLNRKPVEIGTEGKVKTVLSKPAHMVLVQFESDNMAFVVPGNLDPA